MTRRLGARTRRLGARTRRLGARTRLLGARARLVTAAAAALGLAWALAPGSSPPLYDGLGFPDEPYRFVSPPPGYQSTAAPTAASYTVGYQPGGTAIYDISSDEQGPQVELIVRQRGLALPAAAGSVSLRATPVRVPVPPTDAVVWGNVYRVGVAVGSSTVAIRADGHTDQIRLRAPTGPPPTPGIEFYDGSSWRRLVATRIGNDLYVAYLAGAGEYALVTAAGSARVSSAPATGSGATAASSPGGSLPGGSSPAPASPAAPVGSDTVDERPAGAHAGRTVLVIVGVALVALVALIFGVRLTRRGRPS